MTYLSWGLEVNLEGRLARGEANCLLRSNALALELTVGLGLKSTLIKIIAYFQAKVKPTVRNRQKCISSPLINHPHAGTIRLADSMRDC